MRPWRVIAIICTTLVILGTAGCGRKTESNAEGQPKRDALAEAESEQLIKVPLPDKGGEAEQNIIIDVNGDGTYVVDRTSYSFEALEDLLRNMAGDVEGKCVIVRANSNVDFNSIVHVLNMCREQGFSKLALATDARAPAADGDE